MTSPKHVRASRAIPLLAAALPLLGLAAPASADDPLPEMRAVSRAGHFAVGLYKVTAGQEGKFLTALMGAGGYNQVASSFAGEKIVEVLPRAGENNTSYVVIGRYFSPEMTDEVTKKRNEAVAQFLAEPPTNLKATFADSAVGDWSWERARRRHLAPTAGKAMRVRPYTDDALVFERYNTSLNFMKIGYVGQTASVEFLPPTANPAEIQASIAGRPGFSGVAVANLGPGKGYVAYTEYYEVPRSLRLRLAQHDGNPAGGAVGVVVENYMGR